MDNLHLVEFAELRLKSMSDFEAAYDIALSTGLAKYMQKFVLLQPGYWPCQSYCRHIIYHCLGKHHAMVLGTTDYKFSFPVEDSLDLLGMTIDNQLNFNKHVSLVCKKVNNQLNVMIRFRNLICTATKLKLYNAFILPHLQYCSTVWHFCSARNRDQLESLNKRALRVVFNDKVSSY